MMQAREYQITFNKNLAKSVAKHKRVIACLPTGGGKTFCFISITDSAHSRGKTVIIVTESKKIFKQIIAKKEGIEIKAGAQQAFGVMPNKIYIAMAQTLIKRPLIIHQFAQLGDNLLTIVDEAHIGTPNTLLRQLPDCMLLGFTASPDWNSAKHLTEFYKDCVVGAQVSDLLQIGFLAPYKHFARVGADMDKLKIKNGEFTEESQKEAFETSGVYEGLLEDLQKTPYKSGVIFCSSISHCDDVHDMLEFNGYKAAKVHSKVEDHEYQLFQFEQGFYSLCVTVAMINKGYDHPPIDLEVLLFSTKSLPRYLQTIGRGGRPCEGKTHHTCLDYGANYVRFGLWDQDREWDEMWKEQKKRKKGEDKLGVAPVKECPECCAIIPASSLVCEFCGHMMEPEAKPVLEGELVEINEAMDKMRGRRISSLSPQELAIFARMQNKKPYSFRIARAHEQEDPGWLEQFRAAMQYKPYWVTMNMPAPDSEKIEYHDIVIK